MKTNSYVLVRHSTDEDDQKYGIPEQKKFPMPDAKHVRSAIRFFNYAEPRYEKELAAAIMRRMNEYGLTFNDFEVGEENRFSNYIPKDELEHHGILGQKWGVRRYQNEDGTLTEAGKKRLKADSAKLDERQSRAQRWEDKLSDRAQSYNASSRKLIRVPFEKPVKQMRYEWANFGHDRALNSANRWYKKVSKRYGKMGVDALSDSQISKGKAFMNWAESGAMLQARTNAFNTRTRIEMNKMRREIRDIKRDMYY